MGNLYRITKDGLLSIAGMLIEDPVLNHARIDSIGNLYARMLIEDPMLSKVEWGREGIVRCREFWEGGLCAPLPTTPPKHLYIIVNDRVIVVDTNLTRIKDIMATLTLNPFDGNCYDETFIYNFAYLESGNYRNFHKINRQNLTLNEIQYTGYTTKISSLCINQDGQLVSPADVNLFIWDKQGAYIRHVNNIIPPAYAQKAKILMDDNFYYIIGSRYITTYPAIVRITKSLTYVDRYQLPYQGYIMPKILYINGNIYILYYQRRIFKFNCGTQKLDSVTWAASGYDYGHGMVHANNKLYIITGKTTGGYAQLREYDLNLNYLGVKNVSKSLDFDYSILDVTTDSEYLYIITGHAERPLLKISLATGNIIARLPLNLGTYMQFTLEYI